MTTSAAEYGIAVVGCIIGAFVFGVISRKKLNPDKPYLGVIIDTLLYIPAVLQVGPWAVPNDIDLAVVNAIKSTGLKDFGSGDCAFMERYKVVRKVGLSKSKASYSPVGYTVATSILTRRMEQRLKFVDYLKKHPKVEQIKMKSPVFVIGFPRTGTTFLHELLGLHPEVRMHYTWEQMDCVPRTQSEDIRELENDRKIKYKENLKIFDFNVKIVGDAIQKIHRIGFDEPEECTTPCSMELPYALSELPLITYAIKELIEMGGGDTFVVYKKILQLFAFQAEARQSDFTWMLKCPFHLPYLTELHETFPDATVVWTHRDPVECIGSACSLYEVIMTFVMDAHTIDKVALGKAVLEYTRLSLDKAFASIEKHGSAMKILHIRFADNIKNPQGICKQVMETAGIEYSIEYQALVDDYIRKTNEERASLKKKGGTGEVHSYSLEDYGLSKDIINQEFADYVSKYSLKSEKKK